jgi:hypothetical protein
MKADMLTTPLAKDKHRTLTKTMGFEAFDYVQSESVEGRALNKVNRNVFKNNKVRIRPQR